MLDGIFGYSKGSTFSNMTINIFSSLSSSSTKLVLFSIIDAYFLLAPIVDLELEYMQRGFRQLLHRLIALTFCASKIDLFVLSSFKGSNENSRLGFSFLVGFVP